jgi:NAD(P)-dependent dehydrogenase (short-subunit alcohol dehydrogenase family)
MRLDGKVALVTGGTSGIGEAVCRRFAAEGAAVAVLGSQDLVKAQAVANTLGARATAYVCDVRDPAALSALVAQVERELGPIDVLVNSAGVYYATPIGDTAEAEYDRMVDINLKGTFFAINAVVPGMKTRRHGRIVNISSVAAVMGIANYSLYCATKGAIAMMTRALARELAPYDIHINALAPGNTATPLNEALRTLPEHRDYMAGMEALTPSNRAFSPPAEMAALCAFLVSDEARAFHGSLLLADEGISSGLG